LYKTKKCRFYNGICNKEEYCPFYHKNENKRVVNESLEDLLSLKRSKLKELNKIETLFSDTQVGNKSQIIEEHKKHSIHSSSGSIVEFVKKHQQNRSFHHFQKDLNDLNPSDNLSQIVFFEKPESDNKLIDTIRQSSIKNFNNSLIDFAVTNTNSGEAMKFRKINSINSTAERSNSIFSNNSLFSDKLKAIVSSNAENSPPRKSKKSKNRVSTFKRNSRLSSLLENTINLDDKFDQDVSQEIITGIEEIFESSDESFEKDLKAMKHKELDMELQNLPEKLIKEINENTYGQQFFNYLRVNNFNFLLKKIISNELTIHQILTLQEDKLVEFVEDENLPKFQNLVKSIMDINDNNEMDSIFKKIDDDIKNSTQQDES
jgi:hypothetical protein